MELPFWSKMVLKSCKFTYFIMILSVVYVNTIATKLSDNYTRIMIYELH